MSALTDLFSSMANKIRSKTGTATTYTPPQMVSSGIDDVYAAGVASATSPITPSDSSPVAMSANTGYKPTTAGYAIASNPTSITPSNSSPVTISSGTIYKASGNGKAVASITDVTPSSTQVAVSADDIVHIGGSGVIVDSVPTPTSLTPSNSSPATITSGGLYSATAGGKAVSVITDVTPSSTPTIVSADDIVHIGGTGEIVDSIVYITPTNTDPIQYLDVGKNYRLSGNTGYAIKSYSGKTPSDTSPVSLTTNTFYRLTSAGYLVKTVSNIGGTPDRTFTNDSAPSSGAVDISVTQKPRYIILGLWHRANAYQGLVGIIDVTKSKGYRMGYFSSAVSGDWSNYTSYFPTISSNIVTYSYSAFAGVSRVKIMIYY